MYLENESTGWDLASHIKLIEAEHLDENKNFVSDIYSEVKTIDEIFSETIPIGHYVRTTFDQNLTKYHRISIFLDKASPTTIEVYANGNLVTAFVCSVGGCQVTLSDLAQEVNVLDFKMVGEDIKFDCIRESKLYNIKFVAFHQNDPNIVYAGDLKSYDGGKSFKIIEFKNEIEGAPSYTGAKIFSMCQSNPDVVYAIYHYSKGILRSDDAGETWRKYHLGSWRFDKSSIHFPTFAVDPVNCDIVYSIDEEGDIAVFNGTEWRSLGLLPFVEKPESMDISISKVAIDPRNNSIIYASIGGGSGISSMWRSTDAGQTWQDISYNRPRMGGTMAVNPYTGSLFAGGACGTWVLPPPYESSTPIYDKAHPVPSCHDGLQNGDETGIDSGGSCA